MVRWCRLLNASRIVGRMAHISVRAVSGGVVARTRATGRIRPSGLVLLRHGIKRRRMFVRALWSMPMNRVIRQEAYPLERVESVTGPASGPMKDRDRQQKSPRLTRHASKTGSAALPIRYNVSQRLALRTACGRARPCASPPTSDRTASGCQNVHPHRGRPGAHQ